MPATRAAARSQRNPEPATSGRLEDGTAYYGRLGELAYDPDEDRLQCHLCGEWFRIVGGSHLHRRHGWTLVEYRDAFRLPIQLPTCSPTISQRLSHTALEHDFGKGEVQPTRRSPSRVRPWRSLAAQHPELVAELHPDRNRDLDPAAIAAKSTSKLWWR